MSGKASNKRHSSFHIPKLVVHRAQNDEKKVVLAILVEIIFGHDAIFASDSLRHYDIVDTAIDIVRYCIDIVRYCIDIVRYKNDIVRYKQIRLFSALFNTQDHVCPMVIVPP